MPHIGMPELFVILALMLLVFGPRKLPEIARGFGQGIKEFKQAMRDTFSGEETPSFSREYPAHGNPSSESAKSDGIHHRDTETQSPTEDRDKTIGQA